MTSLLLPAAEASEAVADVDVVGGEGTTTMEEGCCLAVVGFADPTRRKEGSSRLLTLNTLNRRGDFSPPDAIIMGATAVLLLSEDDEEDMVVAASIVIDWSFITKRFYEEEEEEVSGAF